LEAVVRERDRGRRRRRRQVERMINDSPAIPQDSSSFFDLRTSRH